jgi:flagellar basal-body rod protein FlgC
MSLDNVFDISGSGLKAQMMRMEVLSSNIANINVTRTPLGGPYRRRDVVFESMKINRGFEAHLNRAQNPAEGVQVTSVIEDRAPFKMKFEPGHPDADKNGYVKYPNINIISEMVNIKEAASAYEANISVLLVTKNMIAKTFEIGR